MNYLNLFKGLIEKINFLEEDFSGISININLILTFIISFILSILIILLLYVIGAKVRSLFFKNPDHKPYNFFISIALGYIIFCSGIAVLGIFSILYSWAIIIYILSLAFFAFYPIRKIKGVIRKDFKELRKTFQDGLEPKLLKYGILVFVFLSFLRNLLPETGIDAIFYHLNFPKIFLQNHSVMIEPSNLFYFITVPQAGQMLYVITEFFRLQDGARIIHFLFYILTIMLLYTIAKDFKLKNLSTFVVLLFVTTPIINKHTSTAYTDFQWIFLWILSIWLIIKKLSLSNIVTSAIIFGAVLATKSQGLIFYPAFTAYILISNFKNKLHGIRLSLIFILLSIAIPLIWYIRSFILTGNPFYPQFSRDAPESAHVPIFSDFLSLYVIKLKILGIFNFSPIILVGIMFIIYFFLRRKKIFSYSKEYLFLLLLTFTYFFLGYTFSSGRYLLYFYTYFIVLFSVGIRFLYYNNWLFKNTLSLILIIMVFYYSISAFLILPYGLGWANRDKYLSRTLSKDNSSYFDHDHLFSRWILSKDLVATYNIEGFYYADFRYADVRDLMDGEKKDFNILIKKGSTKLLIRGGDINWFCSKLSLRNCNKNLMLLAKYKPSAQYLYKLK